MGERGAQSAITKVFVPIPLYTVLGVGGLYVQMAWVGMLIGIYGSNMPGFSGKEWKKDQGW